LRMFAFSICLYQSLAPVRSRLLPVTCPRFMRCSFVCGVSCPVPCSIDIIEHDRTIIKDYHAYY
jgi:hypothetical protein